MLSMSERGKLGAKAAKTSINTQKRITEYNKDPIKCKQCQTPMPDKKKKITFKEGKSY